MKSITLIFGVLFLFSCNWNDGEVIIPCSNKIDLGVFELEKKLPTEPDLEVVFENQLGQKKSHFYNSNWGLIIRNKEDVLNYISYTSACVETEEENEFLWQQEQNTAVLLFDLDDGISIKETMAVDVQKPEDGIVGEFFIVRMKGKNTGGFHSEPIMSFSKNKIQTSQNSSYDFGYEFLPTLTLNDQNFENVIRILDTQSEDYTEIYLSEEGEVIGYEERGWLIYLIVK